MRNNIVNPSIVRMKKWYDFRSEKKPTAANNADNTGTAHTVALALSPSVSVVVG